MSEKGRGGHTFLSVLLLPLGLLEPLVLSSDHLLPSRTLGIGVQQLPARREEEEEEAKTIRETADVRETGTQ